MGSAWCGCACPLVLSRGAAAAPATSEVVPTPSVQGWVFNVVPWLVAIPASVLSGFLSDHLISQGESWGRGWAGAMARLHLTLGSREGALLGVQLQRWEEATPLRVGPPALQSQPEVYLWEPGSQPDSASDSPSLTFPMKGGVGAQ